MIEAISGALLFAAALYGLWTIFFGLRRRRANQMGTFLFGAPTRWESDAAIRWLRSELTPNA